MGRNPNQTGEILDAVALLVVDMQAAFLDAIPDASAVIERCAFAVEAASLFGIEVVFTEQVPEKLGRTIQPLRDRAPQARVFSKNTFPALAAPGLQEHLKRRGIYHLLLAGIETPICIYQTALQANDADLDVTVIGDGVGGRRSEDCRLTLEALSKSSCHVLPAEAIFYSMLGSAAHPRFSAFTKLVKHYSLPNPLESRPDLTIGPDARETGEPAEKKKSSRKRSRGRGRRGKAQEEVSPKEPGKPEQTEKTPTAEKRAPEPAPETKPREPAEEKSEPESRKKPATRKSSRSAPKKKSTATGSSTEKSSTATKKVTKKAARRPAKKKATAAAKPAKKARNEND